MYLLHSDSDRQGNCFKCYDSFSTLLLHPGTGQSGRFLFGFFTPGCHSPSLFIHLSTGSLNRQNIWYDKGGEILNTGG